MFWLCHSISVLCQNLCHTNCQWPWPGKISLNLLKNFHHAWSRWAFKIVSVRLAAVHTAAKLHSHIQCVRSLQCPCVCYCQIPITSTMLHGYLTPIVSLHIWMPIYRHSVERKSLTRLNDLFARTVMHDTLLSQMLYNVSNIFNINECSFSLIHTPFFVTNVEHHSFVLIDVGNAV